MGEVGYLLETRVGPQAEVAYLKSFGAGGFHVAQLENEDPRLKAIAWSSLALRASTRLRKQLTVIAGMDSEGDPVPPPSQPERRNGTAN